MCSSSSLDFMGGAREDWPWDTYDFPGGWIQDIQELWWNKVICKWLRNNSMQFLDGLKMSEASTVSIVVWQPLFSCCALKLSNNQATLCYTMSLWVSAIRMKNPRINRRGSSKTSRKILPTEPAIFGHVNPWFDLQQLPHWPCGGWLNTFFFLDLKVKVVNPRSKIQHCPRCQPTFFGNCCFSMFQACSWASSRMSCFFFSDCDGSCLL